MSVSLLELPLALLDQPLPLAYGNICIYTNVGVTQKTSQVMFGG